MDKFFTCLFLPDGQMKPWQGTICPLLPFEPVDFEICSRGSMFHIILGQHSQGRYLCIPNWGIGMDIADPDDCFWNYEHLRAEYPKLSKVDAVSIVNALSAIKHYND